jgi:hypothetical protein
MSSLASVPIEMRPLAAAATDVLSAIIRHTPVAVVEAHRDENGDWFHLTSQDLQDHEVFHRLSNNWQAISGANSLHFSLIHCLAESGRGVWLLHRKVGGPHQYSPGCRQIHSWS